MAKEYLACLSVSVVLVYRVFELEVAFLKTVKGFSLIGEAIDELLLMVFAKFHVVPIFDAQFVTQVVKHQFHIDSSNS